VGQRQHKHGSQVSQPLLAEYVVVQPLLFSWRILQALKLLAQ
jgi:hypothetical protein